MTCSTGRFGLDVVSLQAHKAGHLTRVRCDDDASLMSLEKASSRAQVPDRTGVENEGGARPYLFEHCDGKGGDARFVWQPGAEKHDISPLDIWHQLHGGNRINSAGRRLRNPEHQRLRDCYSERGGVAGAGGHLKPSGAGT